MKVLCSIELVAGNDVTSNVVKARSGFGRIMISVEANK